MSTVQILDHMFKCNSNTIQIQSDPKFNKDGEVHVVRWIIIMMWHEKSDWRWFIHQYITYKIVVDTSYKYIYTVLRITSSEMIPWKN